MKESVVVPHAQALNKLKSNFALNWNKRQAALTWNKIHTINYNFDHLITHILD